MAQVRVLSREHIEGEQDQGHVRSRWRNHVRALVRRPVLQPEVLERLERRRLGLAGRDAVEFERQGHAFSTALSPASRL